MSHKTDLHALEGYRSKVDTLCHRLADIPYNHRQFEATDMPFMLQGKLNEWENLIEFGIPESFEKISDDEDLDEEIASLAAAFNLSPDAFEKRFPQPTSRDEYINTMISFTLSKEQRDYIARSAQQVLHAFPEAPSKIHRELEDIMKKATEISQQIDREIVALLQENKKENKKLK